MKWSYRILRVAGIDVRVHVTFLLLLAFWGWQGYTESGTPGAISQILHVSLLFLCVLLHEFGHAFAARAYGIRTPDITLLPIGGVARLERMPKNPMQELVIAIAGPMVNVVIAAVLWLALGMPTISLRYTAFESGAHEMFYGILLANLFLIAFNLLPAFPMDGGRVLRALLAFRLDHATATRIAGRTGQGVAILFALIGFFGIPDEIRTIPVLGTLSNLFGSGSNPFLLLIAMFVFSGAQQEIAFAGIPSAVTGLRVADAMLARFRTMLADMPLSEAILEAQRDPQPVFPVTDLDLRVTGMVLRNELLQAKGGPGITVASLSSAVPTVGADATFAEAYTLMQESGSPVLPVVNPNGQAVGLVSLNQLSERIRARS